MQSYYLSHPVCVTCPPSFFWSFLETQSFRSFFFFPSKAKAGLEPCVSQSQGLWSSAVMLSWQQHKIKAYRVLRVRLMLAPNISTF